METRESIWSVSRRFRIMYSLVFMILFCAGCVLAAIESGHLRDTRGWGWHTYLSSLVVKIRRIHCSGSRSWSRDHGYIGGM